MFDLRLEKATVMFPPTPSTNQGIEQECRLLSLLTVHSVIPTMSSLSTFLYNRCFPSEKYVHVQSVGLPYVVMWPV